MDTLVGQSLDRYKLLTLLGEGGMGAVFKARDVTLQRDVAVKVMHAHFARQQNFQERFLQEARTAAKLDHPGIVKVYDFGSSRGLLYIVMELIPGDNLRKMIKALQAQNRRLALTEAVELVRQSCLALDYAHRNGVLHRDIKPENLMLKADPVDGLPYRPVLTDLGLAKLASGGMETQEGTSMGTPAYMSPEQAMGQNTDPRSDVYSLGILLFELATGRLPFPSNSLTEAIRYHVKEPPPSPRSINAEITPELEQVILKTLAKKPDERYAHAADMGQALAQVKAGLRPPAPAPTAMENAVSLLTVNEPEDQVRGKSIWQDFTQKPANLRQDRVQYGEEGHTFRTIEMKPGGLTIGRDADNDLPLDNQRVSRHHARIIYEGGVYKVIDLDSTNGTFIDEVRLLPGVPQLWDETKMLRVGSVYLRLERSAQASGDTRVDQGPGTMVDQQPIGAGAVSRPPVNDRVGIVLEIAQFNVAPGSMVSIPLSIVNKSNVVDHFKLRVTGIPQGWVTSPLPAIQLLPGRQEQVTLNILPPRAPQSRAGRYPISIQAFSQDTPTQMAEAKAVLTVGSFSQFTCELKPRRLRAGQTGQLWVTNQGNYQTHYDILWADQADEIRFEPPRTGLAVPEGQAAAVEFRAAPKSRRWFGGEKSHAISAQVAYGEGQGLVTEGELISRAALPAWIVPLALMLCLLLAAGAAALGFGAINAANATRQTAVAQVTADSQKVVGIISERTATAQWLAADDDLDSLPNEQELALGLAVNNGDTDADGLRDGDELARQTDPKVADSDTDGIKDGDEVSRGLNPKSNDSDGDGIQDAVDPDPINKPTLTVAPSDTPTPTPTVTATPSPTPTNTEVPGAWTGDWESACELLGCGKIKMAQTGNQVKGEYSDGNGSMEGNVQGNRLSGTWSLGGASGTFDMWLNQDGKTWQGNWDRSYDWCGFRGGSEAPNPCGLAAWYGQWDSICDSGGICGPVNIIQQGREVVGTWGNGTGNFTGQVFGTTLAGDYQGAGGGSFKFYMLGNGQQFSGNQNGSVGWCGYRSGFGLPDPCYGFDMIIIKERPTWLDNVDNLLIPTASFHILLPSVTPVP